MKFIDERLNKDNLRNLVFWLMVTCGVYFSAPISFLLAIAVFIFMSFLITKLSPLTVVETRPELILEFPDPFSCTANSAEKTEKKELPAVVQHLVNSEGKIVSDKNPNFMLPAWSPLLIGVPLFILLWKGLGIDLPAFLFVGTFFFIPVSIFILYNRPISLLFDWRAWYLQGWRQINGSSGRRVIDDPYYWSISYTRNH